LDRLRRLCQGVQFVWGVERGGDRISDVSDLAARDLRREFCADQVLVDLGEQDLVGICVFENEGFDG
jgi:hypothetical protein